MTDKIINYEELEKPMLQIEEILGEYDMEESSLILSKVVQRINQKKQDFLIQENAQKAIQGLSLKNIWKMLRKKDKGDGEDGLER